MEDPFYGNGSGVQQSFDFSKEKSSGNTKRFQSAKWLEVPCHFYPVADVVRAWASCSRQRGLRLASDRDLPEGLLEKECDVP